MDVFISWSGNRSKKLAEVLSDWLPGVIQAARPYFTPDDIAKGTKWNSEISKKLEACQIGLLCITADNFTAPWINFEAGALSKNLDKSRVCPILFDLEPANVTGPIVQFQLTQFNKADFKRLIETINSELGDSRIAENTLNTVFDMWWPQLEDKVKREFAKPTKVNEKSVTRTDRELLEELLTLVRTNAEVRDVSMAPQALSDVAIRFVNLVTKISNLDNGYMLARDLLRLFAPIEYLISSNPGAVQEMRSLKLAELELNAMRLHLKAQNVQTFQAGVEDPLIDQESSKD